MNFEIELTKEQIQESVQILIAEKLKSSYDNPIKKAVDEAFKEKELDIQTAVTKAIGVALSDDSLKDKLGDLVIAKMFENAFKNR